jgi:hypothetical protein
MYQDGTFPHGATLPPNTPPQPTPVVPAMKPRPPLTDDALIDLGRASRCMEDAPAGVVERAFAIWRPRTATPGMMQRLTALLRFDDWATQAAPALRSARPRVRQMIFSADEVDVDLRIEPAPASQPAAWVLRGQVLGVPTTCTVALLDAGDRARTTTCDEFGAFVLDDVPAGSYRLSIEAVDTRVDLPAFDVGP